MKRELGLEVLKNNGVYLLYLCSLLLWVSTSKLGPIFISSVEIAALLFVILFLSEKIKVFTIIQLLCKMSSERHIV